MALGHAGVGVTELPGDDRHRHCPHGQDRGVSVPQDVETDGGHDAGLGAGFAHRAELFGPVSSPARRRDAAGRRWVSGPPLAVRRARAPRR